MSDSGGEQFRPPESDTSQTSKSDTSQTPEKAEVYRVPPEIGAIIQRNDRLWQETNPEVFQAQVSQWIQEIRNGHDGSAGLVALLNTGNDPKISIVIPAHNEERYILQLLQSLANQKYDKGIEVIVVDNNSNSDDRTADWAEQCGAKVIKYTLSEDDPRRKLSQIAMARQKGLEAAKGEIIISTDADCIAPDLLVKTLTAPLEEDQNITAVTGHLGLYSPSAKVTYGHKLLNTLRRGLTIGLNHGWIENKKPNRGPTAGANTAFRKADAMEAGGYDENVLPGEDSVMGFKLLNYGNINYVTGEDARMWTSPRRLNDINIRDAIKGKQVRDFYVNEEGEIINNR